MWMLLLIYCTLIMYGPSHTLVIQIWKHFSSFSTWLKWHWKNWNILVFFTFLPWVILWILVTTSQFCDNIWTKDIHSILYSHHKLKSFQYKVTGKTIFLDVLAYASPDWCKFRLGNHILHMQNYFLRRVADDFSSY